MAPLTGVIGWRVALIRGWRKPRNTPTTETWLDAIDCQTSTRRRRTYQLLGGAPICYTDCLDMPWQQRSTESGKYSSQIAICEKPRVAIDSAVHMSVISEAWLQLHTYPTCKNVTALKRPTEKVLCIKPNVER